MVRSGNLLLCLLVAVAGGARWAKMTDLGSGSFLSIQLPSSLLDGITCRVSVVVNAAITVLIKETAVMDALVRCQREIHHLMCSHVFSFFSQEAPKGPRQNGETGRSTGQRWEDLGGNKTTQTKTRSKWMRARQSRAPSRKHRCQKSRMRNFEIQGEYGLGTVHVGVQYIQRPNSAEKKNQSLSRASRSLPVKAV